MPNKQMLLSSDFIQHLKKITRLTAQERKAFESLLLPPWSKARRYSTLPKNGLKKGFSIVRFIIVASCQRFCNSHIQAKALEAK
jgi:hypothetical protein